jgi:hypothetical protein
MLVAAVCLSTACADDSDPSAGSSVATTTSVDTTSSTVAESVPGVTESVPTSTSSTVAETTTSTTTPPPVGWQPIEALPSLAYPPCCGSNWSGAPSPAIPADAATPLTPGIYHAQRIASDAATDSITFEVARFEACSVAPTITCDSDGAFDPDEMGVEEPAARGYTLALDDSVRVGVSGFVCENDQQTATGTELQAMFVAFDRSYDQLLGGPYTAGESIDELRDALADTPTGGFAQPECSSGLVGENDLVWTGDVGPGVLLQVQLAYDSDGGQQVVPKSASAEFVRLNAIEIAADGSPTLYFYAGYSP